MSQGDHFAAWDVEQLRRAVEPLRHERFRLHETMFCGLPIVKDPSLPVNIVELRDASGRKLTSFRFG